MEKWAESEGIMLEAGTKAELLIGSLTPVATTDLGTNIAGVEGRKESTQHSRLLCLRSALSDDFQKSVSPIYAKSAESLDTSKSGNSDRQDKFFFRNGKKRDKTKDERNHRIQ